MGCIAKTAKQIVMPLSDDGLNLYIDEEGQAHELRDMPSSVTRVVVMNC